MSISSDLSRIQAAKSGLASKIPASGLISTYPSQIQDIIDDANATTGETDTTLADAVGTLIDGYGQGGSGGIVITDTVDAAGGTIREITAQEISGTLSITQNGTYDVTQYASAEVNVSGGGGSGAVSGTFTPASDLRSITLPDTIGKSSILIYPMFDIANAEITSRVHWGSLISGGRCIIVISTNSGKNSYAANITMSAATGTTSTADSFNPDTGTVTINGGADNNYGGYYISGKQYGYIAW